MAAPSPAYVERLTPSAGILALGVGAGAMIAVVLLPATTWGAGVAGVLVACAAMMVLWFSAPRITVQDGSFRAGRARIAVTLLGHPEVVGTREDLRRELGPMLDARAYVVLRSWLPTAVRVPLTDPADPTPYWLVSTRHPDLLVAAIAAATAATHTDGP